STARSRRSPPLPAGRGTNRRSAGRTSGHSDDPHKNGLEPEEGGQGAAGQLPLAPVQDQGLHALPEFRRRRAEGISGRDVASLTPAPAYAGNQPSGSDRLASTEWRSSSPRPPIRGRAVAARRRPSSASSPSTRD